MLARQKLIQCFTCKNNLPCWGLDLDIPHGKNIRECSIQSQALTIFIAKYLGDDDISIGEQYGILSGWFMQSLRSDGITTKRDIYQLICVLGALCNTSDDTWVCPGEDSADKKTFVFERLK
jgi:hypothetical protein